MRFVGTFQTTIKIGLMALSPSDRWVDSNAVALISIRREIRQIELVDFWTHSQPPGWECSEEPLVPIS